MKPSSIGAHLNRKSQSPTRTDNVLNSLLNRQSPDTAKMSPPPAPLRPDHFHEQCMQTQTSQDSITTKRITTFYNNLHEPVNQWLLPSIKQPIKVVEASRKGYCCSQPLLEQIPDPTQVISTQETPRDTKFESPGNKSALQIKVHVSSDFSSNRSTSLAGRQ